MENLRSYGLMFMELADEIKKNLESKTDEELYELNEEAISATNINCSWGEYRIAQTVLECITSEHKNRLDKFMSN